MKKSDLKSGMLVRERCGCVYCVFGVCLRDATNCFSLKYINEDLTSRRGEKHDIVKVADGTKQWGSMEELFFNFNSLPTLWKREEYNFKPGDKVQVRDKEDEEWQNAYFIQKIEDGEVYKWSTTIRDEFTAGMNFEEMNCKIGTPWVYIRPYKEG